MKRATFLQALGLTLASMAGGEEGKGKKLPVAGESFELGGREAFLIRPKEEKKKGVKEDKEGMPWVWYAPTLPGLPGVEERWLFEQFLASGIGIAGIDAGESYGSPDGRKVYDLLYAELTERRGMGKRPVMLGRSRGGLMTLSWAAMRFLTDASMIFVPALTSPKAAVSEMESRMPAIPCSCMRSATNLSSCRHSK